MQVHRLDEPNLRPAAIEVLAGPRGPVVAVSRQVVGEEAQSHDVGDGPARLGQQGGLAFREE